MSDAYSILFGEDPSEADLRQARIAQMRKQAQLGQFGELTGDPVLTKFGQGVEQRATQGEQEIRGEPAAKFKTALERIQGTKLAGDVAATEKRRAAMADPSSLGSVFRTAMGRSFGMDVPEGTPGEAIDDKELELAERSKVAADRLAALRRVGKGAGGGGKGTKGMDAPTGDAQDIASAIESGKTPPDVKQYGKKVQAEVAAELARRGFDLSAAQMDWGATQHTISTLNGPQQNRLRQAIDFTSHALNNVESLYREWQDKGPATGFRTLNKATLALAKQHGGEIGSIAQALEGQLNDLTSEQANIFTGGNSPTEEALKLAKANLAADWDEPTFTRSLALLRKNLKLRANSIQTSAPAGIGKSRYMQDRTAVEPASPVAPAEPAVTHEFVPGKGLVPVGGK